MNSKPLVSIVIPSLNQGRFIRDALDSTLSQSHRPLEVIVTDGASTDDTVSILTDYSSRWEELRWKSEPDHGIADAVNKGLSAARGEIVGIHSADDIYLRDAIPQAVDAFRSHPHLGLVYGDGCQTDAAAMTVLGVTHYDAFSVEALLTGRTVILQDSAFFRRSAAVDLGGWNPDCYVADLDLWFRMVFQVPVKKIDKVLSAWRVHPEQRNRRTTEIWQSYQAMIDGSSDVPRLPWHLRRAAEASKAAFARHYNPRSTTAFVRRELWRSVAIYPPIIRGFDQKDRALMIPGLSRFLGVVRERLRNDEPAGNDTEIDLRWWLSLTSESATGGSEVEG